MAEGGDLSADQTEKLLQFQDLTGIEDMERCREILIRHSWDMEVAVQSRFSEQEGNASVFHEPAVRETRPPVVDNNPSDQQVLMVNWSRRPRGIMEWGYFIILFPFRFFYSTLYDLLRFVYQLLRPDPRRFVTDPRGDVQKFIQHFNERYGINHANFYNGTYSEALNEAKRDLKFLLVYLHGDDHQDTDHFCRETLCNSEVTEFIDNHMLFWACNTNSPEGYRVSQALRENTYPFLALIVLRENRMTVVAKIEGVNDGELLRTTLTRMMDDNEGSLVAARADRDERSFNQTLREEQDRAYEESLRADQEKERKKKEEREEEERLEQEERRKEEEEEQRLQDIEDRKEILKNEIPEEPLSDETDTIRLVIKLPNGTRLERRFLKTQSLKHLYNYVFVHEAAPDDFQIFSNYPRKTLPCQPTGENPEPPTFQEVGLGPSEMLFVHDNDA